MSRQMEASGCVGVEHCAVLCCAYAMNTTERRREGRRRHRRSATLGQEIQPGRGGWRREAHGCRGGSEKEERGSGRCSVGCVAAGAPLRLLQLLLLLCLLTTPLHHADEGEQAGVQQQAEVQQHRQPHMRSTAAISRRRLRLLALRLPTQLQLSITVREQKRLLLRVGKDAESLASLACVSQLHPHRRGQAPAAAVLRGCCGQR